MQSAKSLNAHAAHAALDSRDMPRVLYITRYMNAGYRHLTDAQNGSNVKTVRPLSRNDVLTYNFKKERAFVEIIAAKENPYVHPYIDIDCKAPKLDKPDTMKCIMDEISALSKRGLGKYTIGGYTNDHTLIESYPFLEYQPRHGKYVSIHAIWYTKAIRYIDLSRYMSKLRKVGDAASSNPFIIMGADLAVYNPGLQKFRHVMSDKPKDDTVDGKFTRTYEQKAVRAVYSLKDGAYVITTPAKHIVNALKNDSTDQLLTYEAFESCCGEIVADESAYKANRERVKASRKTDSVKKSVVNKHIIQLPIVRADVYPDTILSDEEMKRFEIDRRAPQMSRTDKVNAFMNNEWVWDTIIVVLQEIQSASNGEFVIHCRPQGTFEGELSLFHLWCCALQLDSSIQAYIIDVLRGNDMLLSKNARVKGDSYRNEIIHGVVDGKIELVGPYAWMKYVEHYVAMYDVKCKEMAHLAQAFKIYMRTGPGLKMDVRPFEYEGGYSFYDFTKYDLNGIVKDSKAFTMMSRVLRPIDEGNRYAVKWSDGVRIYSAAEFRETYSADKYVCGWDDKHNREIVQTVYDLVHRYRRLLKCEKCVWWCDPNDEDDSVFRIYNPPTIRYIKGYKPELIQRWLDLLKKGLCNDEECGYEYVLRWLSFMIKHPNRKPTSCLIFVGSEGCGKSTWVMPLEHIFGKSFFADNACVDNVTGQFNSSYARYRLVVMNEADMHRKDYDKSKSMEAKFKALITEVKNDFNAKHRDAVIQQESYCGYILLSNTFDAVSIGGDMRRYAFMSTSDAYRNDNGFFAKLRSDYADPDFVCALYSYLMDIDDTGFAEASVPETSIRKSILRTVDDDDDALRFMRESVAGYLQPGSVRFDVGCQNVYEDYKRFCKAHELNPRSQKNFSLRLTDILRVLRKHKSERCNVYELSEHGMTVFSNELADWRAMNAVNEKALDI